MDLRSLRYFQTVAECGSFSRGSALLNVSQPAVSRTIRELEDELGRPLFVRHRAGATITEAGRLLFERSKALLRQLDQTAAEVRGGGAAASGMITIAMPPGVGYILGPPLVERFSTQFPNVALKFVGGYSGYLYESLIRGRVDLACIHDPVPRRDIEVIPLLRQEVFVVGKAGRFSKHNKSVDIDELANLPLILPSSPNASRRLLESWAAREGRWIEAHMEVDDHILMSGLIKRGLGVGLMTQATVHANLRTKEIETRSLMPKAYWPLALIYSKSIMVSKIKHSFIDMTISMVKEMKSAKTWPGLFLETTASKNRA